ncbi:SIR2 family protein [Knoellia sp. LjRoot47]|uniref:SIR2 family protein n=1 Tax=Knoellia sp. LjRoot47 TaxID=3342330 RepID=UPI003ED082B6
MSLTANPLDARVTLATSIQAQPGVYALLIGSGVSTGAGIPTGWGVVQELVRRLATAADPDSPTAGDVAAEDPEGWWSEHGDGQALGYSNLLAAMASTKAARRDLLAEFFEPTDEDLEAGLKMPTDAHRAIAQLVKRGAVKVVLTTNFDRLLERALEEVGVSPQVIARPEAVAGATPLSHATATIVKLHGDYADLEMRNTVDELATYPEQWNRLLDRVCDEYGLLISGWSADWDEALVAALERQPSRRYPMFWDSRSSKGEVARRVLAMHRGHVVEAPDANDLFSGLAARLDALDRLAEPPLTTAMAVARLKRLLLDESKRIDLHDLVAGVAQGALDAGSNLSTTFTTLDGDGLQRHHDELIETTKPLLALICTGAFHDRDGLHDDLWIGTVERLMSAKTLPQGTYHSGAWNLRHLPALLVWRALGLIAVARNDDDFLVRLFDAPTWPDPFDGKRRKPALKVLDDYAVLSPDTINTFPRWNAQKWLYPISHFLTDSLREPLRLFVVDDDEYKWLTERYEYRRAVAQWLKGDNPDWIRVTPGEFIGEWQWEHDGGPRTESDFLASRRADSVVSPWDSGIEAKGGLDAVVSNLRPALKEMRRWG